MIIGDELKVFEALDNYDNNSNLELFKKSLIKLVRP
jgi:hypothetical protein